MVDEEAVNKVLFTLIVLFVVCLIGFTAYMGYQHKFLRHITTLSEQEYEDLLQEDKIYKEKRKERLSDENIEKRCPAKRDSIVSIFGSALCSDLYKDDNLRPLSEFEKIVFQYRKEEQASFPGQMFQIYKNLKVMLQEG